MPDPSRRTWTVLAAVAMALGASALPALAGADDSAAQPVIGARVKAVLTVDGLQFKDVERQRPARRRTRTGGSTRRRAPATSSAKMTLDEKAGMMLIDSLSPGFGGVVSDPAEDYVATRR